jgi:mannose-6-phosphate isomerase class I
MKSKYSDPKNNKNQQASPYGRGSYECFPAIPIEQGTMLNGYEALAEKIKSAIPEGLRTLMIDGYQGVDWHIFRRHLDEELQNQGITAEWQDLQSCWADPAFIRQCLEPFMGGADRVFGSHYPFAAEIFFDAKKMADLRIHAAMARGRAAGHLTIVYGCGAGLLELWDQLWYVDFPKDRAQQEARSNRPLNIGEPEPLSFETYYKRSYFIEWPALNRLRRILLLHIDCFIDGQFVEAPVALAGDDFRQALHQLSETPFRVRPWFFPGPWGGKFMQGHMGLDPQQPNFAWSFELIVPENGIILQQEDRQLEFSFDWLMAQENERVLGREAARQFKYEWPIRLDYLDTIDGGNLSTQVHPRPDYIRFHFGETYTQDETYYIVQAKPDARVYLGLTESCDPAEFRKDLEGSINTGKEIDIDSYVHSEPSKVHDLFLIPNGTVHCSGAGNLVLEISATPYIFTFKIYDYLRRDLEGKLRPINIERGFDNIRFERRKDWVRQNLLAKPQLLRKGKNWREVLLYDKPFTFYTIRRAEFVREFRTDTAGRALAINLVEGDRIEIIAANGRRTMLRYLESMVIPAATGRVKMINRSQAECKVVLVAVKPGIGVNLPLNDPQDG